MRNGQLRLPIQRWLAVKAYRAGKRGDRVTEARLYEAAALLAVSNSIPPTTPSRPAAANDA